VYAYASAAKSGGASAAWVRRHSDQAAGYLDLSACYLHIAISTSISVSEQTTQRVAPTSGCMLPAGHGVHAPGGRNASIKDALQLPMNRYSMGEFSLLMNMSEF